MSYICEKTGFTATMPDGETIHGDAFADGSNRLLLRISGRGNSTREPDYHIHTWDHWFDSRIEGRVSTMLLVSGQFVRTKKLLDYIEE